MAFGTEPLRTTAAQSDGLFIFFNRYPEDLSQVEEKEWFFRNDWAVFMVHDKGYPMRLAILLRLHAGSRNGIKRSFHHPVQTTYQTFQPARKHTKSSIESVDSPIVYYLHSSRTHIPGANGLQAPWKPPVPKLHSKQPAWSGGWKTPNGSFIATRLHNTSDGGGHGNATGSRLIKLQKYQHKNLLCSNH